jgi:hypothetical protein
MPKGLYSVYLHKKLDGFLSLYHRTIALQCDSNGTVITTLSSAYECVEISWNITKAQ